MKLFAIILFSFGLISCDLAGRAEKAGEAFADEAADLADAKLKADIWGVCKGNSAGAIDRHFFQIQEMADLWIDLCHGQSDIDLGPSE